MEFKDLEKKLESISTPKIEIQSHKQRLKMALLSSGYVKEEKIINPIMFWRKRLVLAGGVLALILILGLTIVYPKIQLAKAMEIAKKDPQIQQLMKDYRMEIKEVKLHDGKAYVLLSLPEEKLPPLLPLKGNEKTVMSEGGQFYIIYKDPRTGEIIKSSGLIAEINLKAERVERLELVEKMVDITPLTKEEEAQAIKIAKSDPKIKEMLPKDTKIVTVRPLPPLRVKIQTTKDEVKIKPYAQEDRRVNVIFESEKGQNIIITVNLSTEAIEGVMSAGEIKSLPEYLRPKHKFYPKPDDFKPLPSREGGTGGGVLEKEKSSPSVNEKEIYAQILQDLAQKDQRIKHLLKDNDYKILEVIKSKPIITESERMKTIKVETITIVLEKESTKEKYWITIDGDGRSMSVKSIEKK